MAINKATLSKVSQDGTIHYIYPKTTADLVFYENGKTVQDVINALEQTVTGTADGMSANYVSKSDDTYNEALNDITDLKAYINNTVKDWFNTYETIDTAISSTSNRLVRNSTIFSALDTKVDKVAGKGLSTNDFTTEEKNKLSKALITDDVGNANGVAPLDANSMIPAAYLPAFVDDILEGYFDNEYDNNTDRPKIIYKDSGKTEKYYTQSSGVDNGESGKIYISLASNRTYRWTPNGYAEVSPQIALGQTSSTAYPGNLGKSLSDNLSSHSSNTNNPHNVTASQVGLSDDAINSKIDSHVTKNYIMQKLSMSDGQDIEFTDTTYDVATTSSDGLMSKEDKSILDGIHNVYEVSSHITSATDINDNAISSPQNVATIHGNVLCNSDVCIANLNIEINSNLSEDCKSLTIRFNPGTAKLFASASTAEILDYGYTFYNVNIASQYDANNNGTIEANEGIEYQTLSAACPYIVTVDTSDSTRNSIIISSEGANLLPGSILSVNFSRKLTS